MGEGEDCEEEGGWKEPTSRRCAEGTGASCISSVNKGKGATEEKSHVKGWFTEKMEEKESKQEFRDTEEMVQRVKKTISKMGSRLLGENLFTVQEGLRFAVKERHAGEHNRNMGDEAGHGRCDKESQSKRRN